MSNKLPRRTFLKSSALVAGAASFHDWNILLAEQARAPHLQIPKSPRERISVATWPFRAEIVSPTNEYRNPKIPGMDLVDFCANVPKTFSVTQIEPLNSHFSDTKSAYISHFRNTLEEAGVRVVNIPVDNEHSYYDADPAVRKQAVDNGKRWIDIALALGSPSVRTSIAAAQNAKPSVDVVAEQLKPLAVYAAERNVLLNLENDNLESEDAFFLVKVIKKVNHPYLHALPDFCNSMQKGDEKFNYDAVAALFPLAYSICHVKDSEADEGKVVRVDLKRTFDILNKSNYKGYCSMEFEGEGSPYDGTKALIAATLANLPASA